MGWKKKNYRVAHSSRNDNSSRGGRVRANSSLRIDSNNGKRATVWWMMGGILLAGLTTLEIVMKKKEGST